MAILSRDQALALIKSPKHTKEIQKAKVKRLRHQLHTEAQTDLLVETDSARHFLAWVRAILNSDDNYNRFVQLFRPPVATNKLVDAIFQTFEKVFEGQNAFENFQFTTPELENDFQEYRKQIGDLNFWKTQGMETFKNSIDNYVIIDLPALQPIPGTDGLYPPIPADGRPRPYYYILDLDRLIDVRNTKVVANDGYNGETPRSFYYFKTEYIIFNDEVELPDGSEQCRVCVFDDIFYRVYLKSGENYSLISEFPHGLGYCPARSFWTRPLNSKSKIQKSGPITESLSDLDWLLFYKIAERYLQLYAPFPIYAVYEQRCSYREEATKRKCVGGFLEFDGQRNIAGIGGGAEGMNLQRVPCPRCSKSMPVGPGNVLKIQPPKESGDANLMENPMQVIPAEVTSLDYVRKFIAQEEDRIKVDCIGRSTDTNDAQAKNELQIESGFESSESILLGIKRNFEIVHNFTLDAVAELRYGSDYKGGFVDYGDQFYDKTEDEEVEDYKVAVESNLPSYELAARRNDIAATRYKNNPKMLERFNILRNLEPFPDLNLEGVQKLRQAMTTLVSDVDFAIKANFIGFIDRFEREQAPIPIFGAKLSFDRRVALINEELVKYANEVIEANSPKDDPNAPPQNPAKITAQANLQGSVGGVTALLAVQAGVIAKTTTPESAIAIFTIVFGFTDEEARKLLGQPGKEDPAPSTPGGGAPPVPPGDPVPPPFPPAS